MTLRLVLKAVCQVLALILPWSLRRPLLNLLPGFAFARGSRLGWCLILAERAILARGARIGNFTIVNPIGLLQLNEMASIGKGNRIVGAQRAETYRRETGRISALVMGRHAGITRDHLIDCTNTVTLGAFALVAGWGSQFLTHGPDFAKSRQVSGPITIGEYTFVGTGCIILKGAEVPARSIVAAGSVIIGRLTEELQIYAGNPARAVKALPPDTAFFHRPVGRMRHAWGEDGNEFGG
jgi:acetyltransferase-like isoleucine patch superfamily enzyme